MTRPVRLWLTALSALVALVVLGVVSVRTGSLPQARPGTAPTVATDSAIEPRLDAARRLADDPFALGALAAPVVIAEWGDFQCPFCRAFDQDVQPALINDYVASGKVRLEWHDLAKLGAESVLAARAARAAGRQGAFWPFHDALYRDQAPENSGAVTAESLTAKARAMGLDVERFVRDFADPDVAAQIERDRAEATRLGITHVPTFLVNGVLLVGAQPLDTLSQTIEAALKKSP